jgi:GntR family transcriptional repressor for pyruvate dehydrogenase complex
MSDFGVTVKSGLVTVVFIYCLTGMAAPEKSREATDEPLSEGREDSNRPVDLGARLQQAAADPATSALFSVRRVRKAYEQVADQLRALIVGGQLKVGDRLPNETALAKEFGVSRATVREALRTLSAQRLILTAKGTGGGTRVVSPGFDFISEFLEANMNLLTEMHHITLEELLEAREHLEVPAARLAARRRSNADLDRLRELVPSAETALDKNERFGFNINFHSVLVEISGNGLLYISALPIFSVLQTNLARGELNEKWHEDVSVQHGEIADAIQAGDEDQAGSLMEEHLGFIRPAYERIWRHAVDKGQRR